MTGNEEADKAAKQAIQCSNYQMHLPLGDWILQIKSVVQKNWQNHWTEVPILNKLREIKETVKMWDTSHQRSRYEEVILTRLRIGHTNITHKHLMSTPNSSPPVCDTCQTQITVKHIFLECQKFNRFRYIFRNRTLSEILAEGKDFSMDAILIFLKCCKLLKDI